MKVTYPGPYEALDIADGQTVKRGETVDVSDALGAELIAQGWTEPATRGRKASNKE